MNPLQHLPVVGTVYRALTGDKMGDVEKVAGDTLYGGPIGLVSSLADVAFEKITGKSFEDTAIGWVGLGGSESKTVEAATAPALKPLPSRTTQAANITPVIAPVVRPATAQQVSATTAPQQLPTQISAQTNDANTQALMAAMNQNGVDSDLVHARALFAYQKQMGLALQTAAPIRRRNLNPARKPAPSDRPFPAASDAPGDRRPHPPDGPAQRAVPCVRYPRRIPA